MILLFFYGQEFASYSPIVSTQTIEKPVDYFLAGDSEKDPKNRMGRTPAHPSIMKMIFRE